jgi:hypothetical protein
LSFGLIVGGAGVGGDLVAADFSVSVTVASNELVDCGETAADDDDEEEEEEDDDDDDEEDIELSRLSPPVPLLFDGKDDGS